MDMSIPEFPLPVETKAAGHPFAGSDGGPSFDPVIEQSRENGASVIRAVSVKLQQALKTL